MRFRTVFDVWLQNRKPNCQKPYADHGHTDYHPKTGGELPRGGPIATPGIASEGIPDARKATQVPSDLCTVCQ